MWATLWLALSLSIGSCYAYSAGPPTSACTDMIPIGHGAVPQTSTAPYTITAATSAYLPGFSISVTISGIGLAQFKGFFLQARRVTNDFGSSDEALGQFSGFTANTQTLNCGFGTSNAWSHSASLDRQSVTATWTAPPQNEGPIRFRATIVQGPNTVYWTDVYSASLASAPIISCPSASYGSRSSQIILPAPVVSGFNGPVTFTYSQASGNLITLADSNVPYHTISNVDRIQSGQTISVTANDGSNTRRCDVLTFTPNLPNGLPILTCPADQYQEATGSTANMIVNGAQAFDGTTFAQQLVTYTTSPYVALTPSTPTLDSLLTGTFQLGTTYFLASADYNGYTTACTFAVTVVELNCPAVVVTPTTTTAQWTSPTPLGFPNNPPVTISYTYTSSNGLLTPQPTTLPDGTTKQFTFPFDSTTSVTATASDTIRTASCTFTVTTPGPTIVCPLGLVYSSSNGQIILPAPAVSGFPGQVTYSYTQNSGNTITLVNSNLGIPYHTLLGVDFGQQTITVRASDGTYFRDCPIQVYAFAVNLPTISCPAYRHAQLTGSTNTAQLSLTAATARDTFLNPLPVTYLSSPVVTLTPSGSVVDGTFSGGTTYVFAYTTLSGLTIGCFFTVTVVDLSCPADLNFPSSTAQWVRPSPLYFPNVNTVSITYAYTGSNLQLQTTVVPVTGLIQATNLPPGTTSITATAFDTNNVNTATCTFSVTTPQGPTITCPNNQIISGTAQDSQFVTFPPATAVDSNGNSLAILSYTPDQTVSNLDTVFSPHSGTFSPGTTVVTATSASDSNNLNAVCVFSITVLGLRCPDPIFSGSATVAWDSPTQIIGIANLVSPLSYSSTSGTFTPTPLAGGRQQYNFAVGVTTVVTVTATAADPNTGSTATATCVFPVTVSAPQAPTIDCPSHDVVSTTNLNTHTVVFNPATASDSNGNSLPIASYTPDQSVSNLDTVFTPHSGSFSPGTTFVTVVSAPDGNGLTAMCIFSITVLALSCPTPSNIVSTSVLWNNPISAGFPDNNNVFITYTDGNGNTIQTTPQANNQQLATFAAGTTTVITATANANDGSGNTATCEFTVTTPAVLVPPTVTCSNDLKYDSTSDVSVSFNAATARDSNNNPLGVSYSYSSDVQNRIENTNPVTGTFPIGVTTVTALSAPDGNGQTNFCQFTVTVVGLICPFPPPSTVTSISWSNPSLVGFPNPNDVTINYFFAANNNPLNTYFAPNGLRAYDFPSGQTIVRAVASDNSGNSAVCQFTAEFNPQGPTATCPNDRLLNSNVSPTFVSFSPATATDSSGLSLNVNYSPSQTVANLNLVSGTFNLGITTVTVTSDPDSNGLSGSCMFTITVIGLTCPDPISSAIATVQWNSPVPSGFVNLISTTYSYDTNGATINQITLVNGMQQYDFPVGETTVVRATATDVNGNTATCAFPVTVAQPQAPTIRCPPDKVVVAPSLDPFLVDFPPAEAWDSNGNSLSIESYEPVSNLDTVFTPHSGDFSPGLTIVTVTTVADANGLKKSCEFSIRVLALICYQPSNVVSSSVFWNNPQPFGFPDINNVFITYADANGNSIPAIPQPNNQQQFTFPSGTTTGVTATANDGSVNRATCTFTVTTPPASVTCPSQTFTTFTDEIDIPLPTVTGFGDSAIVTYSILSATLGTFIVGTPTATLIGLNLGTNMVEATVNDGIGNSGNCQIIVIVQEPNFGPWSVWNPCILIVDSCERSRTRVCNDPKPIDAIMCNGENFQEEVCPFGSCGVASWDDWSDWLPCSVTCGTGTRSRSRNCNDPIPTDNDYCVGDPTETQNCYDTPCVGWTLWSIWSQCTVSCNGGTRTRTRTCIDDTGQVQDSSLCGSGMSEEVEICNTLVCPPDPVWLPWSEWGDCSVRCDGGTQERTRLCSDPDQQDQIYCNGQTDLSGLQRETRPCNTEICPEPSWYQWGPWTPCSATCDRGFRWRNRQCFDPFDDDLETCVGFNTETELCNDFGCPVASWEEWGPWGGCSATCGTALRTRYRDCNDHNPQDNDVCEGSASSTESCYSEPCPFPVWRPWGEWSQCTATCGGGTRQRIRSCDDSDDDPLTYCVGSNFDTVTCNTLQCEEATWTSWTGWGACSEPCGAGIRTRQRSCLNPAPGQTCPGSTSDTQSCYVQACTEPTWLQWAPWESCNVLCGGGTRQRTRLCSEADQDACVNPGFPGAVETEDCNEHTCAELTWTEWAVWSTCTASCGGGSQYRTRQCLDPNPYDNERCPGEGQETNICNQNDCPQSQWERWSEWGSCSAPCNGGVRERTRDCFDQGGRGPPCPGAESEVEICNTAICPAYWGEWEDWGPCSQTCGDGIERRERSCIEPNPLDIGCLPDPDESFQTRSCFRATCVTWNTWFPWSDCTVSCNGGNRQRFRTCYNPDPLRLPDCEGGNTDTDPIPCNEDPCPGWNNWGPWGDCSVTCDGGTRQRIRTCNDQDRTDTSDCEGPRIELDPYPCDVQSCESPEVGWTSWSPWTGCSRSCGIGLQQRVRTCNDPDRFDDISCGDGDRADSRVCDHGECPPELVPEWNEWQEWMCSVSCGGGLRARFRTCNDPDENDDKFCFGINIEEDPFPCNAQDCPVPYWNPWGAWEECSVSCGGGTRERGRTCHVPPTSAPGLYCEGPDVQPDSSPCNPQDCPVILPPTWSEWGPWDLCSVTCNGGIRERTRSCNDPDQFDSLQCVGSATDRDTFQCNTQACPGPPSWNAWQPWGSCTERCEGGEQVRIRTCNDPDQNDGRFCESGDSIQSQDCNTMPCAAWSPWNAWNECSVVCGGGQRRRERNCNSLEPEYDDTCPGLAFDSITCNSEDCPQETNIALISGLVVAGVLLAMIIAAICLLVFCRRKPATVIYKEPPTPSPQPSPPAHRAFEEVELIEEPRHETRWVARQVPGVRAIVHDDPPRMSRVRPALLVDGDSGGTRYVGSVGDKIILDSGFGKRRDGMFDGINNSYI